MSIVVRKHITAGACRLRSIDTLRGLAILLVVTYHTSQLFQWRPWMAASLNLGILGVELFFVLSAVTMCLMWERRGSEPARTLNFYIRRVMRIAPPYWLALLLYQWQHEWLGEALATDYQITLNALLLHALSPTAINSAVPGGWSIGVEVIFYAVFPVLATRFEKPVSVLALAFTAYLLLGVGLVSGLSRFTDISPLALYYSPLTQFPVFCIGICVYAVSMGRHHRAAKGLLSLAIVWIVAAFAIKYVLHLEGRPYFWLPVFLLGAMTYLCIVRGWVVGLLAHLGAVSYSLYLVHMAVILTLKNLLPDEWRTDNRFYPMFLLATLLVSAALSWVARITIEAWSIKLGVWIVDAFARWQRGSAHDASVDGSMGRTAK